MTSIRINPFTHGDPWLRKLLEYLEGNLRFIREFISGRLPAIRVMPIEGTYLVWLDCRGLGMDDQRLRTFMRKKAVITCVNAMMIKLGILLATKNPEISLVSDFTTIAGYGWKSVHTFFLSLRL